MAGLYFEQFSVGQTFVHEIRRTVTDMDNILFSSLTYNPAAVHIDHEYAKSTEFGKPLMNSIFTLGLIIGISVQDTTLGTTVGNLGMEETRFPRPVFAGDTLRAETKILAVRDSKSRPTQGIVTFEHRGFNQRNEEIAYCRRIIRQRREQDVVHVGDRAPDFMDKGLTDQELFEVESRHFQPSLVFRPGISNYRFSAE